MRSLRLPFCHSFVCSLRLEQENSRTRYSGRRPLNMIGVGKGRPSESDYFCVDLDSHVDLGSVSIARQHTDARIDIAILSVRPPVCLSVCPSVCP